MAGVRYDACGNGKDIFNYDDPGELSVTKKRFPQ